MTTRAILAVASTALFTAFPSSAQESLILRSRWPDFGRGPAAGIAVRDGIAFVGSGPGGLQIVDVRDPARPGRLGGVEGTVFAVALAGRHAIAAGGREVRIIDVSRPDRPRVEGAVAIDGPVFTAAAEGSLAVLGNYTTGLTFVDFSNSADPRPVGVYREPGVTSSVFPARAVLRDRRLYFTRGRTALQILDLSVPASPVLLGRYTLTTESVNDVVVSGDRAYLAVRAGLEIVDVKDPAKPLFVARHAIPGPYGVDAIDRLFLDDSTLWLQCPGTRRLWKFDTGGTGGPTDHAELPSARTETVAGGLAFVSTDGMHLVDLKAAPSPRVVGGYPSYDYGRSFAVRGSTAWVNDSAGLHVLDWSDAARPVQVGLAAPLPWPIRTVSENVLFTFRHGEAPVIELAHIAPRTVPVPAGTYPLTTNQYESVTLVPSGTSLLVTGNRRTDVYRGSLEIVDVSRPTAPTRQSLLEWTNFVYLPAVSGSMAVLLRSTDNAGVVHSLVTVDIADPRRPRVLGDAPLNRGIVGLALAGNHAYLQQETGIDVYDLSDPAAPRRANHVAIARENLANLTVSGGRLYSLDARYEFSVGEYIWRVQVFDLSDPASPRLLTQHRADRGTFVADGDRVYQADPYRLNLMQLVSGTPSLAAARSGDGQLTFSWDERFRGMTLQTSVHPHPSLWVDVPDSGTTNRTTIPATQNAAFHRLASP